MDKKLNESIGSCPACHTGDLICFLCDYIVEEPPNPPTLSNNDAYHACACPACDGGVTECDECGYTYDFIKGFNDYVF
jgi:hypothetical protein